MEKLSKAPPPSHLFSPIAIGEKVKSRQQNLSSPEKVFRNIRVYELLQTPCNKRG
jgi:hypothetical protein